MTGRAQNRQNEIRLDKLLAGDHEAFAEFVDKYKQMVFLCCRTLGLREDEVEDVASDTFLAAYNSLSRYRGKSELSTWLWRIAYCQAVNYLRKNRRDIQLLVEPAEQLADKAGSEPAATVESKDRAEFVWRAVKRLPRAWALVIVLFYREGKSVLEIAKIMGRPENTIKTYLFRGRKRLRQIIAPAMGEDIDVGR